MPRPPRHLQQRFAVDVAAWGEHVTLCKIDLAGVHIPAGFWTDFGSSPWLTRWAVPSMGRSIGAYLVHDKLYRHQPCTRAYADRLMLEIMRWYGTHWLRRWLAYAGLRLFGWIAWRRNKRKLLYAGTTVEPLPPTRDEE